MLKRSIAVVLTCASGVSAQQIAVYAEHDNYALSAGESVTVNILTSATGPGSYAVAGFWINVIGNNTPGITVTDFALQPEFAALASPTAESIGDDVIGQDGGQFFYPSLNLFPANTSNPAIIMSITYTADASYNGSAATFIIDPYTPPGSPGPVTVGMSWYSEDRYLYGDYPADMLTNPTFTYVPVDYGTFTINVPAAPTASLLGAVTLAVSVRRRR